MSTRHRVGFLFCLISVWCVSADSLPKANHTLAEYGSLITMAIGLVLVLVERETK